MMHLAKAPCEYYSTCLYPNSPFEVYFLSMQTLYWNPAPVLLPYSLHISHPVRQEGYVVKWILHSASEDNQWYWFILPATFSRLLVLLWGLRVVCQGSEVFCLSVFWTTQVVPQIWLYFSILSIFTLSTIHLCKVFQRCDFVHPEVGTFVALWNLLTLVY